MDDTRSSVLFFGEPWAAPALDGAVHVPAPVGEPCLTCTEPIAEDDRGFVRTIIRDAGILTAYEVAPVHAECEALGIVGHLFRVCFCTGHDTTSRASARLLWERLGHQPRLGEADWMTKPEIAMQVRCVHCLREQYVLNVIFVSTGEAGCSWCRRMARPMTEVEYRTALQARLDAQAKTP